MRLTTRRKFLFGALALAGGAAVAAWPLYRQFGASAADAIESPHWQGGAFHNLPDSYVYEGLAKEPHYSGGWLRFFLDRSGDRYPPAPRPAVRADLRSLKDGQFVWLGHSSLLLRLAGKTFCIDPVLSSRASPVPFTIPAWPGTSPYQPKDFPVIDYLCITHDHWDHLDYTAVRNLKFRHVVCGKGVGAHFSCWGVCPDPVELDWFDECRAGEARIAFTPSRHFSGRGLARNRTLWGGFVIHAGSGGRIYATGDGGYGSHFAETGRRYGPFDCIFPDCGQYNRAWAGVHMFPEQAVQAALDTGSGAACPVHRGRFTLAWHPWDEPERRFVKRAREAGLPCLLPALGAVQDLPA